MAKKMNEKQFLKYIVKELKGIKAGMELCEYEELEFEVQELIDEIKKRKNNC